VDRRSSLKIVWAFHSRYICRHSWISRRWQLSHGAESVQAHGCGDCVVKHDERLIQTSRELFLWLWEWERSNPDAVFEVTGESETLPMHDRVHPTYKTILHHESFEIVWEVVIYDAALLWILDILTILPFHVAPLRPSSPSVPIYPPFRSRNQPTFLLPPSLGKSRLQLIFGPPLESYPLTSPKNASQCSRNSQSRTYYSVVLGILATIAERLIWYSPYLGWETCTVTGMEAMAFQIRTKMPLERKDGPTSSEGDFLSFQLPERLERGI